MNLKRIKSLREYYNYTQIQIAINRLITEISIISPINL